MLKSIDHLILAVDDLSISKNFYSDLFGFPPTWEGVHKGLGTKNAIFSFENMYLELLTKNGDGVGATFVDNHIKLNGEGLAGIALEVVDINKASLDFAEKGIEVGEYINGEGLSSSKKIRTWKSLYLAKELTRGIFTILIEHSSEKILYKHTEDSSHIKRLDHVVINSNDPDGAIKLYRDIYGIRLALDQFMKDWGGRMLFFRINKTTIELVGKPDSKNNKDKLWGFAWSVDNIEQTYNRLIKSGIEVSEVRSGRKANTLVCSIESKASPVPTLLIQHF